MNPEGRPGVMCDISVIIVSWNVRDFLQRCLASIYRFAEGISFEVFVVDNHSADGSAGMVKQEFPEAHLIENPLNMGFATANNTAFKISSGRYRLLLNPDTELIDNALKKMVDFMDSRKDIDALGCRLLLGDGTLQRSCRHFPSIFTDLMETFYLDSIFPSSQFFNRYRMGSWGHDDTRQVDQVFGACLLVRQEVLKRVGFLDENLFMYYDEIDLCYRIKKSGGKVFFIDTVSVIHYSNKSSDQDADACERYKDHSRLCFFKKHYGLLSVYILAINLAVKTFIVWGVFGVLHLLFKHPRNLEYLKKPVRIMWIEQARFLKNKKQVYQNISGVAI